ncbi:hypothetical protein GT901_24055 [Vibrio parahaemolyticus]|nr:hypothetical protein [Vibrio parahaemolyticus]EGR2993423.1 hypothetical protein [Vibrio parahaemolyticus]EGR3244987.1 hypothetical protein [Vibrio parahaemolyticus]EJG0217704.1 hypothetical protein [Vibrio parahaemolyticus]
MNRYIGIDTSAAERLESIIDKAIFEGRGFVQIGIPYRMIHVWEAERFIRCRFRGHEIKLEEHCNYHVYRIANVEGDHNLIVEFYDEERDMSFTSKLLKKAHFALCKLVRKRDDSSTIWIDN